MERSFCQHLDLLSSLALFLFGVTPYLGLEEAGAAGTAKIPILLLVAGYMALARMLLPIAIDLIDRVA